MLDFTVVTREQTEGRGIVWPHGPAVATVTVAMRDDDGHEYHASVLLPDWSVRSYQAMFSEFVRLTLGCAGITQDGLDALPENGPLPGPMLALHHKPNDYVRIIDRQGRGWSTGWANGQQYKQAVRF